MLDAGMQQESRQCFPNHSASKDRRRLLEILCREYVEETESMLQYQHHAERMHYRQFRERLLRIAEEEKKHAQWLEGRIVSLGGEVPHISFTPDERQNSWECLRVDLEAERRCRADLIERLLSVARIDPEIAEGLRRIREEEERHHEEIMDMLMRSDPQAGWPA